jgi:long-chain acyl-CoA synthetase
VPDSYHGEVVKACVVLKHGSAVTETELIAHCREGLAPYKVPRLVEIRDSVPTSAVGKVLYRVLRDELRTGSDRVDGDRFRPGGETKAL